MSDPGTPKKTETWIWRLHIYIGLYLLLFTILYFVSGLILNHSNWKFTQYWQKREVVTFEKNIQIPEAEGDLARARDIMEQLDISGEINLPARRPKEGQFIFGVSRLGKNRRVEINLSTGIASVRETNVNIWGVLYASHLFTGVRGNQKRDWIMTRIWSISMDAVGIGLIFLVISSVYLWYKRKRNKLPGLIILGISLFLCLFFIFGLNWMG